MLRTVSSILFPFQQDRCERCDGTKEVNSVFRELRLRIKIEKRDDGTLVTLPFPSRSYGRIRLVPGSNYLAVFSASPTLPVGDEDDATEPTFRYDLEGFGDVDAAILENLGDDQAQVYIPGKK
jgi:hypothetical protein